MIALIISAMTVVAAYAAAALYQPTETAKLHKFEEKISNSLLGNFSLVAVIFGFLVTLFSFAISVEHTIYGKVIYQQTVVLFLQGVIFLVAGVTYLAVTYALTEVEVS